MNPIDDDEFLSIARMGVDAEAFLRTPLGRFLIQRANFQIEQAIEDLIAADPEDVKQNREIRNDIHVAKMFKEWMTQAVNCGRNANAQIETLEDLDG